MERTPHVTTQPQGHTPRRRQWQITRWSLLLWLLLPLSIINAQTDVAPTEAASPFGVVEGFWFPEMTCDLGVGWERIIFDWSQHQPNGPTDWFTLNVDDRWLKAANQCNREVVALLKSTPAWATAGIPGAGVPNGLYLPVDDPDNHWANFVRQSARYYAPRGVNRFIIGNEPDISRETYGFEFEGDLDDYFQMLKVAYLAAKQGNPTAEIHIAGTTYWHDVNAGRRLYLDRLLERISEDEDAAANNFYFDAISLHIYFRTDSVYDIVTEMHGLLDSYGMGDKAVWVNETNAPPTQDPEWNVDRPVYPYTLEQQAAFLVQAAALAHAADVERMAVYKLYDQDLPPGGETFGILRPADASQRPAFVAWQTVNRLLADVEAATLLQSETVDVVVMRRADDTQVIAAWARTDTDVTLQLSGGNGAIYDMSGGEEPFGTFVGSAEVNLPGATCNGDDPAVPCPVGGPVALVEVVEGELTIQEMQADGTMSALVAKTESQNDNE